MKAPKQIKEISNKYVIERSARSRIKRNNPYDIKAAYVWAQQISENINSPEIEPYRIVALAPLISGVQHHTELSIGVALKKARISERYVKRLLEADCESVIFKLQKIIKLLDGTINILELVQTVLYWNDLQATRLAASYFGIDDEVEQSLL